MMLRGVFVAAFVVVVCARMHAQEANSARPSTPNLRVVSVGGFLGQLDGFCEQPGGTYDLTVKALPCGPDLRPTRPLPPPVGNWPATLGGLLGARTWVHAEVKAADEKKLPKPLVLVTGNNQVADFSVLQRRAKEAMTVEQRRAAASTVSRVSQVQVQSANFWDVMRELNADAVALGPEDFIRSLRRVDPRKNPSQPGDPVAPVQSFVEWVPVQKLPFLATNVVVRRIKEKLNATKSGEYALSFETGKSVHWQVGFSITYPCKPEPRFELWDSTTSPAVQVTLRAERSNDCEEDADKEGERTFLQGTLKPGKHYELRALNGANTLARLTFETDSVLTPHWNGLPVITKPGPGGEPIVIVSMVDVATKKALGEQAWTWEVTEDEKLEVDFLAPNAVLQAIADHLAADSTSGLKGAPIVVLLSGLEDDNTLKLLEEFPEIRCVLLPPDSALLGSASRESVDDAKRRAATEWGTRKRAVQSFSGDLGLSAVLNAPQPSATTLVARPQWIGETIAELKSVVSRNADGEWAFGDAWAEIHTIAGSTLEAYDVKNGEVSYRTTWEDKPYELGRFKSYLTCDTTSPPPACKEFSEIWVLAPTFNAVAGDALKKTMHTELAIVPVDFIDDYVPKWLKPAITNSQTDWISEFVLQRLVYRSHHTVRAIVPGDKLFDTLSKVADDATGYCIVGIGDGCVRAIDKKHPERLRVNGRPIDTKLAYSLAIPDILAETMGLRHSDNPEKMKDALSALDFHLTNIAWFMPPFKDEKGKDVAVPGRLAARDRDKIQRYISVTSLEVGFSKLWLGLPDENADALPNLDVDFSGAEKAETLSYKLDVDAAAFDWVKQAIRVTGALDYKRRIDEDGFSYEKDEFTVGARADLWKWHPASEIRPYIGYFIEGPFARHIKKFTASRPLTDGARPGFATSESATGKTSLEIDASRYWYYAAGVDLSEKSKVPVSDGFSVTWTQLGLQYAQGHRDMPVDVFIGGEPQGLDRYLMLGGGKLLNAFFKDHPGDFHSIIPYKFDLQKRDQRRLQVDVALELAGKVGERELKFGVEYRHRFFGIEDPTSLALKHTIKNVYTLSIPFWQRFELAPTVEYQRARVHAAEHNVFSSWRTEILVKIPVVIKRSFGLFAN